VKYLPPKLFLLLVLILSSCSAYLAADKIDKSGVVDELFVDSETQLITEQQYSFYYSALDWLGSKAVRFGLISAWSLAIAYEEGTIVNQDYLKAFKLFQSLANRGSEEGQYAVGVYYANGLGVNKNSETAVAWFRLAARGGDAPSQRELARILMYDVDYGIDYETAFYWASSASELGDLDAQVLLAILYDGGNGVAQDRKKAFYWRLNAAEQGWVHAAYLVALSYEMGTGVKRNYSEAFYWYQYAYDNGHFSAQYYLGLLYIKGMGVKQDFVKGVELIKFVAEQDAAHAQYYMGLAYLDGIVVSGNDSLAIDWFRLAIESDHVDAQVSLAMMYLDGRGVERDLDKALNLINLAASQDSAYAAYILGRLYKDNLWLPLDIELGLLWLTKSAELGSTKAMISLIEFYSSKQIDVEYRGKARFWLERMQNSTEDLVKLSWAQVALETVRDEGISARAFEYLLDAQVRDVPGAYGQLSWLYRTGLGMYFGVVKDEEQALEIAKNGADRFDINSFYQLGIFHEFGSESLPINYRLAAEMYEQSTILGSLSAKFRLGLLFLEGDGVSQDVDYSLSLIEGAAKEGLEEAYSFLGWAYQNGYYVRQDIEVAMSFYRAAAEHGDVDGQYQLSVLLRQSEKYEAIDEGKFWLEEAAKADHSEAQFELSLSLASHDSEEDRIKAVEWAKLSANSSNPRGISMLAWLLGEGVGTLKDLQQAKSLYMQAANMGDSYGQFRLARMMYEGDRMDVDKVGALELLVKACDSGTEEACHYVQNQKSLQGLYSAASRGDQNAQYSLGIEFGNGTLVPRDYKKSLKWYHLAAEQGHAIAQNEVGLIYEKGLGIEQSYSDAFHWYQLAAEQGNAVSQHNLGLLYANGLGMTQDHFEAFKWYQKSANQGYLRAQNDVGLMYEKGFGIEQNYTDAFHWYRMAAEQGNPISQHNLGLLYVNGRGIEKDIIKALEFYRKSAEQGYVRAQLDLGYTYQNGKGVKKDKKEAVKWYRLAAEQGSSYAIKTLRSMDKDYLKERLCHPLEPEEITKSCDLFNLSKEYNDFFKQSLDSIIKNYNAPKSDGKKYNGEIKFCLNKDGGFAQVQLTKPSGHDGLNQAMLNAINLTDKLFIPADTCLQNRAYFIRNTLSFDETDLVN